MKIGDIVRGKVVNMRKTHFHIMLSDGTKGIVHISNISDYFVGNIKTLFANDEKFFFKVIEISDNKLRLSWKELMPRFLKDPFEFKIQETKSGFDKIKEITMKEVEND